MERRIFQGGALSALIGVALGAFGAHALEARVSPDRLATWETAVFYQLVHALGLLAVAWAVERWPGRTTRAAGAFFAVGTLLFSGSLYLLVLTETPWLGAVTPLGGLAFLLGWACLLLSARLPRARSAGFR